MRIVAIMGTTRNGRTREVVERIDAYFQGKGDPAFEYVYLKDRNIDFCTGCHNCIFIGEDHCPLRDDVREIEARMMEADAVIFASPAYMMNVTAIMKNFLDRVAYNCHRPKYFGKQALLVSNSSPFATKAAVKAMRDFAQNAGFTCMELMTSLLPMPMNEEAVRREWHKVEQMAEAFYRAVAEPKTRRLNTGDLMLFTSMKTLAQLMPDTMKADYAYFAERGAYDGKPWYIDDVKIPLFPRLMAGLMAPMVKKGMAGMLDRTRQG